MNVKRYILRDVNYICIIFIVLLSDANYVDHSCQLVAVKLCQNHVIDNLVFLPFFPLSRTRVQIFEAKRMENGLMPNFFTFK